MTVTLRPKIEKLYEYMETESTTRSILNTKRYSTLSSTELVYRKEGTIVGCKRDVSIT